VVDQRAQAAHRRRHHGGAARGGLEGDQAERLAAAGHEHHVGGAVVGRQHVVGLRRREAHALAHAEIGRQLLDALDLAVAAHAAGAPHHQQDRGGVVELGQGPHGDVEALERLDAPDEQQHHRVARDPEPSAGGRGVGEPEEVQVDPRRHGDHLVGPGAVEPGELPRLVVARRDEPVGLGDDAVLADQPGKRLRGVAIGQ
jgi:hypothetical protein